MNEYIIYTTEGFAFPPNGTERIDNCQILGRCFGNDEKNACENLIKENPWIIESGFDINNIICKQLMTERIDRILKQTQEENAFLIELLDKKQQEEYKNRFGER